MASASGAVGNGGAAGNTVREWGLFSFKGKRRTMEDTHVVADPVDASAAADLGLFAVFDGHGGKGASAYCQEHILAVVKEELAAAPDAVEPEGLKRIFAKVDAGIKESGVDFAGSTAAVCIWDRAKRCVRVANVGDTHAVIIPAAEDDEKKLLTDKARRLTVEHHCEGDELERIKAAGGFVNAGRVNGMICVSRSLGDHNMKNLLISEPAVATVEAVPVGSILLIACDGIWDVMTTEDAVAAIAAPPSPTETAAECAKRILKTAYDKGSQDNLSVMIVRL